MEYSTYNKILESVTKMAPIESGVQALVYMLILEVLKDNEHEQINAVIIDRMQNHSVFMSYGGISDIALVKNGFDYTISGRDEIKLCIEVKNVLEEINNRQIKQQLLTYKKAIITNGSKWVFYKLDDTFFTHELKDKINVVIEKENRLAQIKKDLRGCYITRTNYLKKEAETDEIDSIISKHVSEKIKLEDAIASFRKKIDGKVGYRTIKPETQFEIVDQKSIDEVREKIIEYIK